MMIPRSPNMEKLLTYLHFTNTGKISKAVSIIVSLVLLTKDQSITHLYTALAARKVKLVKVCIVSQH